MSKLRLVIAVVLLVLLAGLAATEKEGGDTKPVPTGKQASYKKTTGEAGEFSYAFFEADPENARLIANFENKYASGRLVSDNGCTKGINGGFYDEYGEPLGWWTSRGEVRKEYTRNNLFNGFVAVGNDGTFYVGRAYPGNGMAWGVQTGPVVIDGGEVTKLALATDKPSRRSVMVKTGEKTMMGLIIFSDNSRLDGPTLANLGKVVEQIANQEKWQVDAAINLDGGTASAFYTADTHIGEMMVVGSWICVDDD